jgi:integral membrane sensor domain MASE1
MHKKILTHWRIAPAILSLAAVYFVVGRLGLSFATVHPSASAIWPPSGIALAALLLWGYRLWPGVFLGAFLVNTTTQVTVATTLAIASGNTLEALLGAWLVNHFANPKVFERAKSTFKFVLLAGLISTTVSASLGVSSLTLGGVRSSGSIDGYLANLVAWRHSRLSADCPATDNLAETAVPRAEAQTDTGSGRFTANHSIGGVHRLFDRNA